MDFLKTWSYIALIGAIIIILAIMMPKQGKRNMSSRQATNDEIEQIELSLGQFMDNMETQHDELVSVLSTSINQLKEEARDQLVHNTALEKKCAILEDQMSTLSHAFVALETKYELLMNQKSTIPHEVTRQDLTDATSKAARAPQSNSIHSRYAEIFEFYDAGKSIEFIAKKVGKNKGEVQLIIELAKKEENVQNG